MLHLEGVLKLSEDALDQVDLSRANIRSYSRQADESGDEVHLSKVNRILAIAPST